MYGFSKNTGVSTNINAASLEVHNFFILRGIFRELSDRKKTKETAKRRKECLKLLHQSPDNKTTGGSD